MGFYINGNKCTKCDGTCKTCTNGSKYDCKECLDGRNFFTNVDKSKECITCNTSD